MQCKCVGEIKSALTKDFTDNPRFKKPVKRVDLLGVGFGIDSKNNFRARTYNVVEIELEGQKKKERVSLFHCFCPFCGKPTGEVENPTNEKD